MTTNNNMLYNPDDDRYFTGTSTEFGARYHAFYSSIRDGLSVRKRLATKQDLLDLIKRNSKKNVVELNKVIVGMINIDPEFKNEMLAMT